MFINLTKSPIPFLAVIPSIHYLSVMAICSNMAEPVFAFQFPEIDVLLGKTNKLHENKKIPQTRQCFLPVKEG